VREFPPSGVFVLYRISRYYDKVYTFCITLMRNEMPRQIAGIVYVYSGLSNE